MISPFGLMHWRLDKLSLLVNREFQFFEQTREKILDLRIAIDGTDALSNYAAMTDYTLIDEAARTLKVSQAVAYKWRKRGLPVWAQLELLKRSAPGSAPVGNPAS